MRFLAPRDAWRRHRGAVAFCLALAVVSGLAGAALELTLRSTLDQGRAWASVKTQMELELLGSRSFHRGRQALAGGVLDLGAWHGYQAVETLEAFDWTAVELALRLDEGAYLALLVEPGPDRDPAGVRLSRTRRFPPIAFTVDEEGAFSRRRRLPGVPLLADGEWHRLRLETTAEGARVRLDGAEIASVALERTGPGRIGLRGGYRSARIDEVRVWDRDGLVFEDGFDAPAAALRRTLVWIAGALAVTLVYFSVGLAWARGRDRERILPMAMATFLLVHVVCAGLLLLGARRRAADYPSSDRELKAQEEIWRREEVERIRQRVAERYAPQPPPGTLRILAVGTSQTWGAGARNEEDVWVSRLERLLEAEAPPGTRVEAINAGVASARSHHLAPLVEGEWMALAPDLVLIDLGNNDSQVVPFERNVRHMIAAARAGGARVALIPEPNSIERWGPSLAQRHEALRRIAAELEVPVIEMQAHLRAHYDSGFLWWDKVHLTSYGHRLFAEKVAADLRAAELFEPQGAAGR